MQFFGMFWVPLGLGLMLFLTMCARVVERKVRVLWTLVFLCVSTLIMYLGPMEVDSKSIEQLFLNLLMAFSAAAPTFVVPFFVFEITSRLTERTWVRIAVAAVSGVPMVVYSIVFLFSVACYLTGDCL
jgi:hypothetical protein